MLRGMMNLISRMSDEGRCVSRCSRLDLIEENGGGGGLTRRMTFTDWRSVRSWCRRYAEAFLSCRRHRIPALSPACRARMLDDLFFRRQSYERLFKACCWWGFGGCDESGDVCAFGCECALKWGVFFIV